MRFRMWFFSAFAVVSMCWMCYQITRVVDIVSKQSTEIALTPTTDTTKSAGQIGTAIGGTIDYGIVACIGIPAFLLFSLLAWRNQVGIKTQKRHEEQLAMKEKEIEMLKTAMIGSKQE